MDGGYDEGYARCPCFWGRAPGSLVHRMISQMGHARGLKVLDLGCGEGKNAYAFACAGAAVVAVDCSEIALENGQREFADAEIRWTLSEAESFLLASDMFDIIVMYGLLHCLPSLEAISGLVDLAKSRTRTGGRHIVVAFNNGPHDLSAHPGFAPTLASHDFYLQRYSDYQIVSESNELIYETHPNNGISHFHSLTRIVASKKK